MRRAGLPLRLAVTTAWLAGAHCRNRAVEMAPVPAGDAAPAPPHAVVADAANHARFDVAEILRRDLAGEGDGIFWIPVKGTFPDEDLLLMPDGSYITHLHDRPSSMGQWRLEEKRLILEGFMGNGTWIVESVRLTRVDGGGGEAHGAAGAMGSRFTGVRREKSSSYGNSTRPGRPVRNVPLAEL